MAATIVSVTILVVTTESALTDLTTLVTMVGGALHSERGQKRFLFSVTHQYSSDSLDAASVSDVTNTVAVSSGIQVNCITTVRCLQSSVTTAGTLAKTF